MNLEQEGEFDKLFWEQKDMVYYLALKYFKQVHDAEEIVQDVFLKVYLNFKKFRKGSSIKTWIYKIALNEIFQKFRKNKKHELLRDYEHDLQIPDESDAIEVTEMKKDFEKFLKKMPRKRAQVMFLRVLEGMSFKMIAQVTESSESSAKNLYSLGLKELKNNMQGGL